MTAVSSLIPVAIGLPLIATAVLVAATPLIGRRLADGISIVCAGLVTVICALQLTHPESIPVYWFGDWLPSDYRQEHIALGIGFAVDPISAGLATFAAMLTMAALIYSLHFFMAVRNFYHALMLIFMSSMIGFSLTADLFNLFVYFELMSVVAFGLTAYKVEEESALEGAINFAVTNSIGGFIILLGMGLIYGETGALNMAQIGHHFSQHPANALAKMAFALMLGGLLIKAAAVPLHFWLIDAHAVAPSPVCVLFSGVMVAMGVYGTFRVYWAMFHVSLLEAEGRIRVILLAAGVITALVGGFLCISQRHIKRMLASSTIAHIGLMLTSGALMTEQALAGMFVYMFGHGLVKGALFMGTGVFLHRIGDVDEINLYRRGKDLGVLLTTTFFVGGVALAGLPPFGTWTGKAMAESAAVEIGLQWLPWLFVLVSMLTAGGVLRMAARVLWGLGPKPEIESGAPTIHEKFETRDPHESVPWTMALTPVVLLALSLAAGIYFYTSDWPRLAAQRLSNQHVYIQTVLFGEPVPAVEHAARFHAAARDVITGIVSVLGAVLLALAGLYLPIFPKTFHGVLEKIVYPPIRALNYGHVGTVIDYVAWITFGVGLLSAAMLVFA
jgi:multicomponent Na+:H+ antiporter subunit D